jgi:hypothetical protein
MAIQMKTNDEKKLQVFASTQNITYYHKNEKQDKHGQYSGK